MKKHVSLDSSAIATASYDFEKLALDIEFRDRRRLSLLRRLARGGLSRSVPERREDNYRLEKMEWLTKKPGTLFPRCRA